MKQKLIILFLLLIAPIKSLAICPVCSVAVSAGLGLSKYFGIDDTISGIWIGGLIVSIIIWTIDWLNKKKIKFLFRKILVVLFYYGIVIIPLYYQGIIGAPGHDICGIDKLIFGVTIGTLVFIFSVWFNNFLKRKNNDKVYFPFQKVVIPVGLLLVTSLILYFFCI